MKCVIPCAGLSSRMSRVPKSLLLVDGMPLIQHVIESWRPSADSFIFVLRRDAIYFWELLPERSAIVFQDEARGLADAILQAEPFIGNTESFIVALGDCLYRGGLVLPKGSLGIGVWTMASQYEYHKSFRVRVQDDRVVEVLEKPKDEPYEGNLCGLGYYFLDSRVFEYIRTTSYEPGGGDFTSILQAMIDAGEILEPVYLRGSYVNVGSPEDLRIAEEMIC